MTIPEIDKDFLRRQLPEFARQTADYHNEKIGKIAYKEFSGYFGSFAQRDGKSNMLRLRCSAGRITVAKLAFIAEMIRKYNISRIHLTTGQTIQLHDLSAEAAAEILEQCLDADIIPFGCGGDYPGNILCSPLSGVEREEYFDVLPYAEAAAQYLVAAIPDGKLPRKFKTGFSNSPQNLTHATMRDLGFAARPDGRFDVYSAGGLGPAPCIGIKMAEAVAPEKILYHIKAMLATFRECGTYTQRSKARTRYLPELLGGEAAYKAAYSERLLQALQEGGLDLQPESTKITKRDFKLITGFRITSQKQPGLYAVNYHPQAGLPKIESFLALADYLQNVKAAELRLAPDQSVYIINLTAPEAAKVMSLTPDTAYNAFTSSVACIGSTVCQMGMGDSQSLLTSCFEEMATQYAASDALPQIYISGCPSSCGTHQIGELGFRGTVKVIKGTAHPAFTMYINGCSLQGSERLGEEVGTLLAEDIPFVLLEIGKHIAQSGLDFAAWQAANPQAIATIVAPYMKKIELLCK